MRRRDAFQKESEADHPGNAAYSTNYQLGCGAVGSPNLTPEKSRSFTLGIIFKPTRWFTFTADYFNIKKPNLIVGGPAANAAKAAYYLVAGNTYASAAGCTAVAAVGAGYSCNVIDAFMFNLHNGPVMHARPSRLGCGKAPSTLSRIQAFRTCPIDALQVTRLTFTPGDPPTRMI